MTKNGLYQYQRACAAIAVAVAAAAHTSAQALSTRHIEVAVTEASADSSPAWNEQTSKFLRSAFGESRSGQRAARLSSFESELEVIA